MKAIGYSLCCLMVCLFTQSCSKADAYGQQLKTADSLSGAVNATIRELEKTDTLLLQKAVTRFAQYQQFIQQNISDTILKAEADNLQHFYNSGKNLEAFQSNRAACLARARLVNSQLQKLTADLKNKAFPAEQSALFVEQEKSEAAHLSDLGSSQKEIFYAGIEEFKTSLRGVELLIKSHNSGELPVIVKDTLSL